MVSEIMDMLPTNPTNDLSGYYLTPTIGAYSARISGDSINRALHPANDAVRNIDPRPETDQYLFGWDEGDFQRLEIQAKKPLSVDVERAGEGVGIQHPLQAPD